MNEKGSSERVKKPSIGMALVPVLFMIVSLAVGIAVYDADPHVPLLLSTIVAAIIAVRLGHSWKSIEASMIKTIGLALQAVLILMIIGSIIGSWIAGGIVPTMIYYGLEIVSPVYYLLAACVISCVVSLAAGNAWSAAGTIGIALMGIGQGLGIPLPMVAGAIISGVYFGDKMSPLSETTNLAPAVVGVELFDHIRNMVYTTVPALVIALLLYWFLGFKYFGQGSDLSNVALIQGVLSEEFVISPFLLIPPLLVVAMLVFKIPAIPGLMAGSIVGALCAVFVQGIPVEEAIAAMHTGFTIQTGLDMTDELLNQGGIESMMSTIALVLIAMSFGGVLEKAKILEVIVKFVLRGVRKTGSLIASTVATCFASNCVGCEQYMSLVIPGRMYLNEYKQRGLHPKVLSRTLEDAGTMTSPLIPWTTCGMFMFAVLGVHAFAYAPYAFLAYISPLIALVYGYLNIKIDRLPAGAEEGTVLADSNELVQAK
ncbi:NhaC family Na+:H+ antiporter [Caldalkalibacillus uzonensis]|uniref:NhaC family Na+:H+ antiporter n=1 Tax=Caldalkalibacillus uzonensis TaxID=353224 RepID=A0ABU0CN21_9BACI|nr:Na+/H+ antiporter NhaC [Caldalkalibacillus uzonensis]MDQ0337805.1 NhaC family Na+:H+ antiporter [Caldalkalibacillus uzonensis]